MADRIRDSIHRWEPRVEDATIRVRSGADPLGNHPRQVDVFIDYAVRGTHERREFAERIAMW
jgi:phage baseplate assembly protein W